MLDTSASMTLLLDRLKRAAEEFLIRLLPDDRAMVGAFNDKIQLLPPEGFVSDQGRLVAQLGELDFGYPTRLWDMRWLRKVPPRRRVASGKGRR